MGAGQIPIMDNPKTRRLLLFLIVVVSFSLSIVYSNVQSYRAESSLTTGYPDSLDYLNMYAGRPGVSLRAYRPLVPFLARLMPALPSWLFNPTKSLDHLTVAVWRFGIVNLFFLIGACLALYILQQGFAMTYLESFLGVLLFLSSQTVMRSAGLPMTDTAFFFFFLLCLIGIQRNNPLLLLVSHTIGISAKELVILSLPMILLAVLPWRRKIIFLACLIPGVIVYIILRFTTGTSPMDGYVTGKVLGYMGAQIRYILSVNGLINLFFSFGLAWIPFGYALLKKVRSPVLLRRWCWLTAIVFVGVILGAGNLSRAMFSAFPVVMPMASLGLIRYLLEEVAHK